MKTNMTTCPQYAANVATVRDTSMLFLLMVSPPSVNQMEGEEVLTAAAAEAFGSNSRDLKEHLDLSWVRISFPDFPYELPQSLSYYLHQYLDSNL